MPIDLYKRNISRRDFLKLASGAAVASAISACVPISSKANANNGQKVQLVYQDWRTDWYPSMVQTMLDKFHATHPNIRVFYTPDPDNLQDKMLADMEAGTAPDVMAGCCDFFPIWGQKGYLLDLRPYVAADIDKTTIADWDPAQYHALFTRNGVQFGLPKYHGSLALYYNKDLFDTYGVDYPTADWGYNDYLMAMQRLTHDRNMDGRTDLWGSMVDISWDRIQVHVNEWGGHFVDPDDPSKSQISRPEALAAMEWLRTRMWDEKVMATSLDVRNVDISVAFSNQQIAMVEDGSWALKDILTGSNFRLGVVPFPSGPVKRATISTTDGFGIYARTRYPDAAWEFLKFLISNDYSRAMAQANYLQPARASMVDEWIQIIKNDFPEKTKDLDLNAFADGQKKGYSVTAEIFANMADARRLTLSAWQQIFTLGMAPIEMMKSVSDQIEAAQKSIYLEKVLA
jgi:multiple sugar transport system substrate-binding protein